VGIWVGGADFWVLAGFAGFGSSLELDFLSRKVRVLSWGAAEPFLGKKTFTKRKFNCN